MRVKVSYVNGKCIATIPLQLTDGRTIVIRRRCDVARVRRRMRRMGAEYEMSGFFGSIGRAARRVARSKAIRSAVKAAAKAANNPIVQQYMPPQVTMALKAAKTASALINRARGGGRGSRAAKNVLKASLVAARRERRMPPRRARRIRAQQMATPSGRAFRYLVTVNRA